MRVARTRKVDATFDLNLAPVLDIIVSIVPMLLLSVAFLQVRMIETPVPQVVAEKIAEQDKLPKVNINLKFSKEGYHFVVVANGKKDELRIATKAGKLDYDTLTLTAYKLKKQYTDIFKLEIAPAATVSYDEIIQTMDALRKVPSKEPKVSFLDTKTNQMVQTDLMFPDVVFSNVLGE